MNYYKEVPFLGTIEETAKTNNLLKRNIFLNGGKCYYKVGTGEN